MIESNPSNGTEVSLLGTSVGHQSATYSMRLDLFLYLLAKSETFDDLRRLFFDHAESNYAGLAAPPAVRAAAAAAAAGRSKV